MFWHILIIFQIIFQILHYLNHYGTYYINRKCAIFSMQNKKDQIILTIQIIAIELREFN